MQPGVVLASTAFRKSWVSASVNSAASPRTDGHGARGQPHRPSRSVAGGGGSDAEIDGLRRADLERDHVEGGRQHLGQAGELFVYRAQAVRGRRVLPHGAPEHLGVHRERVQRAAQVVEQSPEVRRERPPARIIRDGHQVRRADFTAWMPYFASLL